MILQKLPIFLNNNSAKLLIKYDGERNVKKYTIRLLYNDIKHNSLGSDTDLPCAALKEIFRGNDLFEVEDILDFFTNSINIGIETLKKKFGDVSIISVIMEEKDNDILYTLHIQTVKGTRYLSNINYKKIYETLIIEGI